MLVLPSEAADAHGVPRFEYGNLNHLTLDETAALPRLRVGDRHERVRVDRLDETVAMRVGRHAERPDVFSAWHAFLDLRVGRAVIDQRSARRVDEVAEDILVARPQLADLADGAGHRVLVTLHAPLRVVDRAQPLGNLVA